MSNQSQPRVHVGIDDALYYRSHGKAPRGRGGWLFFIDGDRDASRAFNANGTRLQGDGRADQRFRTPEPTEEAPSRVEWSLTGKGEDYAAEVSGPGIPEGVRVGLVAVPTRACPDCNPGDSGCPTCDDHRVIAQPDTEGEGVQGDQDHWRDRAAYWQQAATNLREQLEARAPAPPQPVASEEDFARVRNLLSPGLGVLRYGTADYDALARVLTDARALAQYAKERGERG